MLNQEDAQELDAQAQKYLDGRSSFPPNRDVQASEPLRTSKYKHNLSLNSMQKIPHGTLPSSNNNENDLPSDLPVASDSDTPRTPIKGCMHLPGTIMPTKGHACCPGPVKGVRSISDTFRVMGNQSPRLDSKDYSPASEPAIDWPDSDLPPSDLPVESGNDTPLAEPRTPILARLPRNCTPTKNAPLYMKRHWSVEKILITYQLCQPRKLCRSR